MKSEVRSGVEKILYALVILGLLVGIASALSSAFDHIVRAEAAIVIAPPKFNDVASMTGVVIKDETVVGFHWITFERTDGKIRVAGLAKSSVPIGSRVRVMKATVSGAWTSPAQDIFVVVPTGDVGK